MIKKVLKVVFVVILLSSFTLSFYSCTPESLEEDNEISLSDKDEEPEDKD